MVPIRESMPPENNVTASNVSGSPGTNAFFLPVFGAINNSHGDLRNFVRQTSPDRKLRAVSSRAATFSQRFGSDTGKLMFKFRVQASEADLRAVALSTT